MKVALAQVNLIVGDLEGNLRKIIDWSHRAAQQGAQWVIFPELALIGYPPTDQIAFDAIEQALNHLRQDTQHLDIYIVVGAPEYAPEGKPWNALYVLHKGQVVHRYHKVLLPDYDIFDERRFFRPGQPAAPAQLANSRVGFTICEDIWITDPDTRPLYDINPLEPLKGADWVVNISGSPFSVGHPRRRLEVVKATARQVDAPVVYVNHVGAQTDLIFDGRSCVVNAQGQLLALAPAYEEALLVVELAQPPISEPFVGEPWPGEIVEALTLGIRDFFAKLNLSRAFIGLSGGIDSSVVAALAVRALGPERVVGVLMPSQYTSRESLEDAQQLAQRLGIQTYTLPITEPFEVTVKVLQQAWGNRSFDVTEENIQARLRMIYLHALTNKLGGVVLNTSNKSELATGYGTLYGDMAGALGVLGDVYKTWVYRLGRQLNQEMSPAPIPDRVFQKPPSAELRPNQTDQDTLPPYDVLDTILVRYIELHQRASQIAEATGLDLELVQSVIRLVNQNEYKRYQAPPILRVTSKAFGIGRRMPIVGRYDVTLL